jgi:hypothetical protein
MKNGVNLADAPDRWSTPGLTDARVDAEKDEERENGETETTSGNDGKAQAIISSLNDEAEEGITEADQEGSGSGKQRPRCIVCNEIVSSPCWYCAICPGMPLVKRIFFLVFTADCS